jgi:Lysozyme like domain
VTGCTGGGGTGTQYSYAQLEGLWINAGGAKALAPTMAAIAMAESAGCSTALNPSGASGLWQILGAVDPADQKNLFDPAVNAKEATLKYSSQGLGAWVTYTTGAYKSYLSGSTTPDTNVPSGGSPSSGSGSTGDAGCLLQIGGGSVLGISNPLNVCLISRKGAREIVGALCLTAAGIIGLAAAVILAASAFQHPAATAAVGSIAPVRRVVSAVTP